MSTNEARDVAATPPPYVLDETPLRDPEAIAARDRAWLEHVYDPNDPQLTVRAALVGMVLGGTLGAANLYIGLKVGWNFGMSITASVDDMIPLPTSTTSEASMRRAATLLTASTGGLEWHAMSA